MLGSSFLATLAERAKTQPSSPAIVLLDAGGNPTSSLTYTDLDRRARTMAGALIDHGANGKPVLLPAETSIAFVVALLGCFLAGALATPVPSSLRPPALVRLRSILADAAIEHGAITGISAEALNRSGDGLAWIGDSGSATQPTFVSNDAIALLQYTSGSTGSPKGVLVSHANLAANLAMLKHGFGADETSRMLTWLPLHHDMGLIGQLLLALYCGSVFYMQPPMAFIQRPLRWLEAIDRHRITISGSPNFGYALCNRRASGQNVTALDLSSWTTAFVGAEPVRREVLDTFAATFEAAGFDRMAFLPGYGLAEATVYVTGGPPGTGMILLSDLTASSRGDGDLVASGSIDATIAIVDPDSRRLVPEGTVGEIWVTGDHIASGYWSDKASDVFKARLVDADDRLFLRTGDLGLACGGKLFVKGRRKALIIHRGVKLHPEDVEATITRHDPRLSGAVAVFDAADSGEPQVVALVEVSQSNAADADFNSVLAAAVSAVTQAHGVRLHEIVPVRPRSLARTTSGKIQHGRCRDLYVAGLLAAFRPTASAAPHSAGL